MLRCAFAIVLIAGCSARASSPAWPKSQPSEADGGESLAPHQASAVAAIEASADSDDTKAAAPEAPAAKPEKAEKAADKPAEPAAKEPEVIMTEEIVIEIED